MSLDLEKYRKKLIEERDQLSQQIGTVAEIAEPVSDDRQLDAGEAGLLGTAVRHKVVDMKSDRLERVNAALQSIEDGSYGTCVKCGSEIDPRRLDAEPPAITCMNCLPAEEANFEAHKM
jgi:RNA polymerase-binding transcription factor